MKIIIHEIEQRAEALTLYKFIREVSASILSWDFGCLDWGLSGFP